MKRSSRSSACQLCSASFADIERETPIESEAGKPLRRFRNDCTPDTPADAWITCTVPLRSGLFQLPASANCTFTVTCTPISPGAKPPCVEPLDGFT